MTGVKTGMATLTLHRPALVELAFRQALLGDPDTMAYNHAWGGTIDFPGERWADWYARWVETPGTERFYRYLYAPEADAFVGEVAYHWDEELSEFLCDVIVPAACRGKGYGRRGLALLCDAARDNGITRLYDSIARDNPAVGLFLRSGFQVMRQTEQSFLVAKEL